MKKVITGFKSFITSEQVNQGRAFIAPPGRYFGFDKIVVGDGVSETHIPIKVSHVDLLKYLVTESVTQEQVAVAMTPYGMAYYTDEEISILVPKNTGNSMYRHNILIMEFTWINSEIVNNPTFRIVPGQDCEDATEEFDIYPFLPQVTDVALAKIVVNPEGTIFGDCSIIPLKKPSFIGNPLDDSKFAKVDRDNWFLNSNHEAVGVSGPGNFRLQGSNYSWSMAPTNNIEVDWADQEISVHTIFSFNRPGFYREILISLKNIKSLTLIPGGNLNITSPVKFNKGEMFKIVELGNSTFSIISSYDTFKGPMYEYIERRNQFLRNSTHNNMGMGLTLDNKTATIVGETLRVPDTTNATLVIPGELPLSIRKLMKYENNSETNFSIGSIIHLTIQQLGGHGYTRLTFYKKTGSQTFGFSVGEGFDSDNTVGSFQLKAGPYILKKVSDYHWDILGNNGNISATPKELVSPGEIIGGQAVWRYCTIEKLLSGSVRLRASIYFPQLEDTITHTIHLDTPWFSGARKFLMEHSRHWVTSTISVLIHESGDNIGFFGDNVGSPDYTGTYNIDTTFLP